MALIKIPKEMGSTPGIVDNSNATAITIDSSENVGIGTTSPDTPLEIDGKSTHNTVLHLRSGTPNVYLKLSDSNTTNGGFIGYTTEDMSFWANNTRHMILTSAGHLLLGTTSVIGGAGGSGAQIFLKQAASSNGISSVANSNNNYVRMLHTGTTGKIETTYGTGGSYTPLAFFTNGSERMHIDSAGNVGIGVAPPAWGAAYVSINIGSTGALWATRTAASLTVLSDNSYHNGSASIAKNTGPGSLYTQSSGQHTWGNFASVSAGATQTEVARMRLEAAGNLNLLDGNLIFAAGHGIDFSANAHAGQRTSELLDDYEEGTWTPTIFAVGGSTVTGITVSEAYYTKVGRNVSISLYLSSINLAQLTTGTYLVLGGLPFTCNGYSDFNITYMRGGTTIRGGYAQSGASYIYLCDGNGYESQQGSNHLLTHLIGACTYMTNS